MIPAQTPKQTFAYSGDLSTEYEVGFNFLENAENLTVWLGNGDECRELDSDEVTLSDEGKLVVSTSSFLTTDSTFTACLDIDCEQLLDFKKGEIIDPDVLEKAFDLQTLKLQQMEECLSRVPKLKPGQSLDDLTPGQSLTVDEDGFLVTQTTS